MSKWHKLFSLISCISNHQSLVTSSNFKIFLIEVNRLGNLRALFIYCNNYYSSFVVHSNINMIITNLFDSFSNNLLKINLSLSSNFSEYHTQWIFDSTLASDFRLRIFFKACIEDRVRYVITELVWVASGNILRCKEEVSFF